jgi:amidase
MLPFTAQSAATLARLIRTREATSVAVVEAHLARIAEVNGRLHAVVAMDAEASLAAARAADAALASGAAVGPLHGVPFTVKDWIEAEGLPCAAGFEARRDLVPKLDAPVVARMRAAGAILLGKTKPGIDDAVYPRSRNPYDTARTTGGSSAGEAGIIAAGGSPLGLGSDSGGSLRLPAAWCGIATLKPTAGLVPVTGHFPRVGGMADPRTQIGPMARTVADLALALRVIAGPDDHDPAVVPMPLGDPGELRLAGLRIAVFDTVSGVGPDAKVARALAEAAAAMREAGATVTDARPGRVDEELEITQLYWARTRSYSLSEWRPGKESRLSAEDIERSIFLWDRFNRSMTEFMASYDMVLTPAAPWVAPPIGGERVEDYVYMLPFSLTGWPCAVVRAGTSPDGLPIGVQLAARPWRDHVALAAAGVVERAFGGWVAPPL